MKAHINGSRDTSIILMVMASTVAFFALAATLSKLQQHKQPVSAAMHIHLPDKFDLVKAEIAKRESQSGLLKININRGSVDCGVYHINSIHFKNLEPTTQLEHDIAVEFVYYNVPLTLHDRVAAAIVNDSLNECLARAVFRHQGIKAWHSFGKACR